MIRVFLILPLLTIISCNSEQNLESKKIEPQRWVSITLETGDGEFTLYNDGDSIVHKDWDYELLKSNSKNKWAKDYKKVNERVERSKLSGAEKDSVYFWTNKLVSTPASPLHVCTDYVGHFKAEIKLDNYPEIKQTCEYHSICEWKIISSETKSLHKFFLSKFSGIKK